MAFGLALGATMGIEAEAADGKTYPGTICQYWTPDGTPSETDNANRNKMVVSQFGWVGNADNANFRLGLVCPLVRDSQRSGIERVMVRMRHENCPRISPGVSTTDDITGPNQCRGDTECTLRIMDLNSNIERSRHGPVELLRADGGDGHQAIMWANFEDIGVPDFTSAVELGQGSMFVLFCRLAPSARLTGIYVGEGTGD